MSNTLESASTAAVERWRSNPSIAANELLHLPLSDDPDEQYELSASQRVVANRIWNARSSITVACRGFGKTRLAATLAILKAWMIPGRRVGCLSASFRQSKQIFEEIERIWHQSPLLQQSTTRPPVIGNDSCKLDFKNLPGQDRSTIRALPLADGSKIRGQRFHTIFCDETPHIPADVFSTVIRPMGATSLNPMKNVRIQLEKDRIAALGLPKAEEQGRLEELDHLMGQNQIAMFTSGYYAFNYVFKLYQIYSKRMHGIFEDVPEIEAEGFDNPMDYATFQIPYGAIPKGFLDQRSLKQARTEMSPLHFRMEYEAAWIIDTGGFFHVEDVEGCRASKQGFLDYKMREQGEPGKQYIISIDPARTSDAFAILVSEFDPMFGMKIAHVEQYFKAPTPKMVRRIFELTNLFNTIEVAIDKGGGGLQVADYLAEGLGENTPLYDMDDETYRGLKGRHILKLVDFSSSWIDNAHHGAYNMLQRRQILFPNAILDGSNSSSILDIYHSNNQTVERMISQILSIEPSETRTGKMHYDLPDSGGQFEKHKDLYSAWLIGCDRIYEKLQRGRIPVRTMPLLGIITPRYYA